MVLIKITCQPIPSCKLVDDTIPITGLQFAVTQWSGIALLIPQGF